MNKVLALVALAAVTAALPTRAFAQAGSAAGNEVMPTNPNSNLYNGGRPPAPEASGSAPSRRRASSPGVVGGAYGRSTVPARGGANVPGAAYAPLLDGMLRSLPDFSGSASPLPASVSTADDGSIASADAERLRLGTEWLERNRARMTREQAAALDDLERRLAWLRARGILPTPPVSAGDPATAPASPGVDPSREPKPPAPVRKKGSTAGGSCCTEQWCYDNTFRCKSICNDQGTDFRSAMSCQMTCDRLESRCLGCCSQPTNAAPAGNSTGVPCSGSCWGL